MIFVINKQARAQARAKPELSRAEHTHARTHVRTAARTPEQNALKRAHERYRPRQPEHVLLISFCSLQQTNASAKTQLVSWHTIISISVCSSFVLYFSVCKQKKNTEKRDQPSVHVVFKCEAI